MRKGKAREDVTVPKRKGRELLLPEPHHHQYQSGASSSFSQPPAAPESTLNGQEHLAEELEFGEEIITFDSPIHAYDPTQTALAMAGHSSSSASSSGGTGVGEVKKRKSIKSEGSIEVVGPMEVEGSVKSMGGVTFNGEFSVRDRIEAYGDVEVSGNLSCGYVAFIVREELCKREVC